MYLFIFKLHIQQTSLAVFPCGRQCSTSQVLMKKGGMLSLFWEGGVWGQRKGYRKGAVWGHRGNEGRVKSGDTEEENMGRVWSGSRGKASAGKVQSAGGRGESNTVLREARREERRGSELGLGAPWSFWSSDSQLELQSKSWEGNPTCSGTDSSLRCPCRHHPGRRQGWGWRWRL